MKIKFLCTRSVRIFVIFLSMFLHSCGSKPESKSALVGTYDAKYPFAEEVLIMDATGRFRQQVTFLTSGKTMSASGTWLYDLADGSVVFESNLILVMTGFRKLNPDVEKPQTDFVSYPVLKSFGTVYIGDDEYVLYKQRR
jgi:hypothetical protein